jgi:hypothetical protein
MHSGMKRRSTSANKLHPGGFNIPQIAKSVCSTILEFIAIGCEPLDSTYDLLPNPLLRLLVSEVEIYPGDILQYAYRRFQYSASSMHTAAWHYLLTKLVNAQNPLIILWVSILIY